MKCPRCQGGGEILSSELPWADRHPGAFSPCPNCKGSGLVHRSGLPHQIPPLAYEVSP
jgi:DnaJ-class molecular chaperone